MKIPNGYRKLKAGEIKRDGDKWYLSSEQIWKPTAEQGLSVKDWEPTYIRKLSPVQRQARSAKPCKGFAPRSGSAKPLAAKRKPSCQVVSFRAVKRFSALARKWKAIAANHRRASDWAKKNEQWNAFAMRRHIESTILNCAKELEILIAENAAQRSGQQAKSKLRASSTKRAAARNDGAMARAKKT